MGKSEEGGDRLRLSCNMVWVIWMILAMQETWSGHNPIGFKLKVN